MPVYASIYVYNNNLLSSIFVTIFIIAYLYLNEHIILSPIILLCINIYLMQYNIFQNSLVKNIQDFI